MKWYKAKCVMTAKRWTPSFLCSLLGIPSDCPEHPPKAVGYHIRNAAQCYSITVQ
jgi:hypothetical protein